MGRDETLVHIAKQLDKMVSRRNMDGALALLQELQGMKMSLKLLQATRIGMSVNLIRKHSTDEEIIALAKILIKKWKKLLASEISVDHKEEKPSGKEGERDRSSAGVLETRKHSKEKYKERQDLISSKSSSAGVPKSRMSSTDGDQDWHRKDSSRSMSPTTLSPASRKNSTDNEERELFCKPLITLDLSRKPPIVKKDESGSGSKVKMDPPSSPTFSSPTILPPFLSTGENIRDKCIELLIAALKTDDDYKDYGANCDKMGAEIEDSIHQEFQKTDMKYKNRVRSRISNLKDPKNPNLRKNVLSGAIDLLHFARMSAEEMASDELKELRQVITKEAIREHQMAKTSGTMSSLFQCGKCKKKNCTYNQVQTRSADEPMTTFVLCNECGNRWKFC